MNALLRPAARMAPRGQTDNAAKLRIKPATPVFTDVVMSDVHRIRRTEAGRALFRRLLELDCTVTIERPEPATDPPNAWTRLADQDAEIGRVVIAYDPVDWPHPARFGRPASDVVLFGRLLDAVAMAGGAASSDLSEPDAAAEIAAYLQERTTIPDPPRTKR